MTTSEQIRVLCVRTGVSLSELARRQIAKALNVTYEQYFVLRNGEIVK